MNEDCLNSAKPDQFLPMKNMLKIKLENESGVTTDVPVDADATSNDQDLNTQLGEAFTDLNNVAQGALTQNQPPP